MARLPSAWLPGLIARQARHQPELVVTLQLSYHPLTLPDQFGKVDGVNYGDLATEVATILSMEQKPPTEQYPEVGYWIDTPRARLLARHFERDGKILARLVDVRKPKASRLPDGAALLRAQLHELHDLVPYDLHQAYQAYQAAMKAANAAALEAAFGQAPRSPAQHLKDELDRQLVPARTILQLVAKREQVVQAARADGVVTQETELGGVGGQPAPDVLRIRLDTLSGAFVEDTDVSLRPDGADSIPAEIVDVSQDEVLVRPKRPSDLARLPRPGTRVSVIRQAEAKVDGAVTAAINRARQGDVVGDWDGLTRLLTSPASLDQVPVPDGVPVDPALSQEQQDAVRRALATRQAFLIQGPPGTGKTTVITEIVRQLAARGERVLLVAPMHVAVDEVLSRLSNDPLIWALRVARDAGNVREGLRHLREDEIRAGAVGQVKARLSHPNQDWPTRITWLRQRREALEQLDAAFAAHARLSEALLALKRSGEREALEAELNRSAATAEGIMTEISRADSAAATAQATIAEAAPRLAAAEAHAAEAAAWLATLRMVVQESESRHAAAEHSAAAARQRLSEIASELARLDAGLADLRSRIEALRGAYADGWREDVGSFRDYLAGQQRWQAGRQQQHTSKTARQSTAAQARVTETETRIAELRRQQQQAEAEASRRTVAAESDGRRAARQAEAARAAEAAYQAARARTGFFGKMGDGVGVGELAAKRNAIADRNRDQAAAARDQRFNLLAASRASVTAESTGPLLAAARQDLVQARQARAGVAERSAAEAAEIEICLAALVRLRDWFAEDDDLPATQATLDRATREAAAVAALRDVARESEIAAAAIRARRQNTAAQLAADEAELERTRQSRTAAEKQHAWQTADLTRCNALLARSRDLLAEARKPEGAQAAVEQQARETAAEVRAGYDGALATWQQAPDTRARLEAGLADQTRQQRTLRERLAGVIGQGDEAAARTADAARLAQDAQAKARDVCGGQLPDDLAADVAATPAWIHRVETLIGLEARWRELVGAAGAADADPAEKLGQAVLDATNLVCATVIGIAGSPAAKLADFDTLILDEASRVIDADFLVPAVRARRWILVGDERQLPPYVDQETEQHIHALLALRATEQDRISLDAAVDHIAAVHGELVPGRQIRHAATVDLATRIAQDGTWTADYRADLGVEIDRLGNELASLPGGRKQHDATTALISALAIGQSLSRFERCVTLPGTAGTRARLTTQRRMIAPIAELVREPVYHGEYHTPDEATLAGKGIKPFTGSRYPEPVTFFDTQRSAQPSKLAGTGFVNEFEADLVVGVLHIWDEMAGRGGLPARPSFSVLAFYKAQAALIERRLARRPLRRLHRNVIDSVDKIQGQESDLVVISFVRAQRTKKGVPARPRPGTGLWLQDIHRLNVAVTRARLALALVGDRPTLQNLSGDKEAEAFYANMFRLLDSGAPGTQYVADPVL